MPTRREFLTSISVFACLAVLGGTRGRAAPVQISAAIAHEKASRGELLLLDIRTPAEWSRSGIGASAHPLSIEDPGFLKSLDRLTGGDKSRPIALICAVGGRSAHIQRALARFGYGAVMDVSEGMLGSRAGPGWIRSGLPVKAYRP